MVSHVMQIEKSVIDAQSFMQDKEKRHEMVQTKRQSGLSLTKGSTEELPFSQLTD